MTTLCLGVERVLQPGDCITLKTSTRSTWQMIIDERSKIEEHSGRRYIIKEGVEIRPDVTDILTGFGVVTDSLSFQEAHDPHDPQFIMGSMFFPLTLGNSCFFDIVGPYAGRNTGPVCAIYLNGELIAEAPTTE